MISSCSIIVTLFVSSVILRMSWPNKIGNEFLVICREQGWGLGGNTFSTYIFNEDIAHITS